ncbi:hypothetical protein KKC91_06835 [bacterium]|nr:hypothetical protein [bacterium]
MSTKEEIVDNLRNKDLSAEPELLGFPPLVQALWVLAIVKDKARVRRITAKTISYILAELKEIDLKERAIINAFTGTKKGKAKIDKDNGKTYYEIMSPGRKFLQDSLDHSIKNTEDRVLFFTGEKGWTDLNKNFPKVIELLKGDLCIVDPFYGHGTLYVLEKFGNKRKIRFLSCNLGYKEGKNIALFDTALKQFRKEFKNIEMRKYDKYYELHDRYIIADNALVIVGHGIKDLGNKESFVVFLPKNLVEKFLPILKKSFEERWKKSNTLN